MKIPKSKAQSWSIDIALGVVIFIASFFVLYSILSQNPNAKAEGLKEQSSLIARQLASSDALIRITDNNEINVSRLNELKNLSYGELKQKLRMEGDFCLYFEDESGYLVLMDNSYRGIGAPSINLSGAPCSQK